MIKALEGVDRITAVGLLARATLSLGDVEHPAESMIEREADIRKSIIEEARGRLGIPMEDESADAAERVADLLDSESDGLLKQYDIESALRRLAERGDLPSDLYEIEIVPNIAEMLGNRFLLEKDIIETTVRAPSVEQHFGLPREPHEPALISLFMRTFRTRWPLKDFTMLVAGQRNGFQLHVHQTWRIYPSQVTIAGAKTPIDWLRRFADRYGAEVEVGGQRAKFFLLAEGKIPNTITVSDIPPRHKYLISRFGQNDPIGKTERSALVVAVDIPEYLATLDAFEVRREDIIDEFVQAPRAAA